jgi:hypothetical protein
MRAPGDPAIQGRCCTKIGNKPLLRELCRAARCINELQNDFHRGACLSPRFRSNAFAQTPSPEADACKASGLIALKQKSPQVKDIQIDLDSAKVINTDTNIEGVPIRTVVIGEAYIERAKTEKPQTFVCIIGEKGKVLLTLFSLK